MKKEMTKRVLSAVLALVMLLTVLPSMAMAAPSDDPAPTGNEGLKLSKTATLEDDGTYTIKLEAYATATVSMDTTIKPEPVPADVILILDQSGSMAQNNMQVPAQYVVADVTNGQLTEGTYFYKADKERKITVKKELVQSNVSYVGDNGETYQYGQLSFSWTDSNGNVYYPSRPFVTNSLSTYTRRTQGLNRWYVNDKNSSDTSPREGLGWIFTWSERTRNAFDNKYKVDNFTVEHHSDGTPTVARYMAVTETGDNVYRYTLTYIDKNGETVEAVSYEGKDTDKPPVTLYSRQNKTGTRLEGLQYAVSEFVTTLEETGVNHRVAMVGFGSDDNTNLGNRRYENTELFVGANQYNYFGKRARNKTDTDPRPGPTNNNSTVDVEIASNHYTEAFQDLSTSNGRKNIHDSIDGLNGLGGTYPLAGFKMAESIFALNASNYKTETNTDVENERKPIVIFFTDGAPDAGSSETVAKASDLKTKYNALTYCVACIDESSLNTNSRQFLASVSTSDQPYQLANSADALADFFAKVNREVIEPSITTSVTLTQNAALVDELSDYFALPDDFSIANNVTVQTAPYAGNDAFGAPVAAPSGVTATAYSHGITVTGFDYVAEGNRVYSEKVQSGDEEKEEPRGRKLVVTIRGVLAKDDAVTGVYVDTNSEKSGIWDTANGESVMIKAFTSPKTYLDSKLMVLDYAKRTPVDANGTRVDSAADKIFSKVSAGSTSAVGTYGKAEFISGSGVNYTPTTMAWSNLDTIYTLGKNNDKGDNMTHNMWSKITVMPANNIYYEDTFVTDSDKGTVGIVYTGDWSTMTEGGNVGTAANNDAHGWIESMADDATYSDGTVASSSTRGATAEFTFTGTGVDVYSRTNMQTGAVVAKLYKDGVAKIQKSITVDNLSKSGDYYQIPTAFFHNLDYGTYRVKLTVAPTTMMTGTERSIYYLDGIRVYNPMGDNISNPVVAEAYGDELNATFYNVRDLLLDAENIYNIEGALNGVVFIDFNPDNDKTPDASDSASIGVYKDYGPKNEVYVSKGEGIILNVIPGATVQVGLKAPAGATTAEVTNGDLTTSKNISVNSPSDLYYKITANSQGQIAIANSGDKLLSITSLKLTGEAASDPAPFSVDVPSVMSYARAFSMANAESDTEPEAPDVIIEEQPEKKFTVSQALVNRIMESVRKFFSK